jgi:Uma2 family endonuclease
MSTAARLITADDLFRMSEEETRWCELIDGEIVRMSPPGALHGVVAAHLTRILGSYVHDRRLGVLAASETGFIVSRNPDTVLAPDGAFISGSRLEVTGLPRTYYPEAPSLVFEVVSPRDTVSEAGEKMRRWIRAGVELAWLIDPVGRTVTIYRSSDDIRVLTHRDKLTGEDVVPGFECDIADLFADF